ncbi:Mitochondrial import inner membrane translocase subunit tim22 [Podospora pseudocomata]|uniref:Mitochondrial import inner membrane translocase subunit TIM22 n=1 Tax=Podospora pseudocomata TaxID=2093779 RepID=A0ABR0GNX0_9PEZI|nr:Mitochondrial import inner membrane translocase subunit tim22 [Podospora pseudocomata]
MNFPGGGAGGFPGTGGFPSAGGSGSSATPPMPMPQGDPNVKMLQNLMESCYAKTVMSGGAGFALGGVFGMFMASMAYDTPYHSPQTGTPGQPAIPGIKPPVDISTLPLRKQLAHGFKDMGARSWSTAKNFGQVGALFSGIECGIEGLRAKNDLANGVAAGCLTGGILARNGGPQAAAIGCAGFAAFSAAIDAWMRMPKDED